MLKVWVSLHPQTSLGDHDQRTARFSNFAAVTFPFPVAFIHIWASETILSPSELDWPRIAWPQLARFPCNWTLKNFLIACKKICRREWKDVSPFSRQFSAFPMQISHQQSDRRSLSGREASTTTSRPFFLQPQKPFHIPSVAGNTCIHKHMRLRGRKRTDGRTACERSH